MTRDVKLRNKNVIVVPTGASRRLVFIKDERQSVIGPCESRACIGVHRLHNAKLAKVSQGGVYAEN
jgi:hypothetical protein